MAVAWIDDNPGGLASKLRIFPSSRCFQRRQSSRTLAAAERCRGRRPATAEENVPQAALRPAASATPRSWTTAHPSPGTIHVLYEQPLSEDPARGHSLPAVPAGLPWCGVRPRDNAAPLRRARAASSSYPVAAPTPLWPQPLGARTAGREGGGAGRGGEEADEVKYQIS